MNVIDAIKSRRSVKKYDPEHKLTDEELRVLLTAIALAPTSFNMQNRHTVVVLDAEIKELLQAASWGQEHVRDASVLLMLTGDLAAHRRTDRFLREAPEAARAHLEPMIAQFYEGNAQLLRDEACRSVGLAGMNVMLAARELGYDSCPMIGFDPVRVSEILGLDEEHPPLLMIVVGKASEPANPRLGFLSFEEQVSVDRLGQHGFQGEVEA